MQADRVEMEISKADTKEKKPDGLTVYLAYHIP